MQKLGLGITAPISQPTSRPSRAFSIPQPPPPTTTPPPAPTWLNMQTTPSFTITSSQLPEVNGTYLRGDDYAVYSYNTYYYLRNDGEYLIHMDPSSPDFELIRYSDFVSLGSVRNVGDIFTKLPTNNWYTLPGNAPLALNFTIP